MDDLFASAPWLLEGLLPIFGLFALAIVLGMCTCLWKRPSHDVGSDQNANITILSAAPCRGSESPLLANGDPSHIHSSSQETHQKKANPNRRLPEIPPESGSVGDEMPTNLVYAVVPDRVTVPNGKVSPPQGAMAKKRRAPDVPTQSTPHRRGTEGNPSSDSEIDRDKEHPYARVKKVHPHRKKEHPYAKIKRNSDPQETDTDNYDDLVLTKGRKWSSTDSNIYEPPPVPEKRLDITFPISEEAITTGADASASACSLSSLPSPPAPFKDEAAPPPPDRFRLPGRQTGKTDSFSAASAISGQTRANAELPYMTPPLLRASEERDRHDGCSHFSGDSQDSFNKGYTCICVREPLSHIRTRLVDPHVQVNPDSPYATVTDDSDDMYAAIESTYSAGESETYAQIQLSPSGVVQDESQPPQPPSVDSLRSVTHSFGFHGSDPSLHSGTGSPLPGKRELNSPLPPAPPFDPLAPKTLEEMYAKVTKLKGLTLPRNAEHLRLSPESKHKCGGSDSSDFLQRSSWAGAATFADMNFSDYEVVREGLAAQPLPAVVFATTVELDDCPNYETIQREGKYSGSDPGYETVKGALEPPYSKVRGEGDEESEVGYETVKNLSRSLSPFLSSDPGYEHIQKKESFKSDHGYERVGLEVAEPNYESVSAGEDTDSLSACPPYERLKAPEDSDGDSTPGYERVHRMNGDEEFQEVDLQDSADGLPLYAKVNKSKKKEKMGERSPVSFRRDCSERSSEQSYRSAASHATTNTNGSRKSEIIEDVLLHL
ncbi:unnamed protein product [Darwinula stevensoni]|uniref:Uncharacterized protein n=1 Tax=Darwinula stevensoni TaxID=69355 RepID=A0A7R8XE62_9CRUS|nr:unnamed protein product [Darwinula stevensoni]CAG0890280.1 unnamed protein product [Darwinula stevensoni]